MSNPRPSVISRLLDPLRRASAIDSVEVEGNEPDAVLRALRYRLSELDSVLALVPVGIAVCEDARGESIRVNRHGALLLGVREGANISVHAFDETHPAPFHMSAVGRHLEPEQFPITRALATGEPVEDEALQVERADGIEVDILMSVVPLFDESRGVRGALAAFTDISDQAEEQRDLEARNLSQRAVSRLSLYALSEHDVDSVMRRAVSEVIGTLSADHAEILERRADGGFAVRAMQGREGERRQAGDPGPASARLAERTLALGEPAMLDGQGSDAGTPSGIGVIVQGTMKPYGVLGARFNARRRFSPVEVDFLQTVANLIATVLERARMEQELAESREQLTVAEARKAAERTEQLASLGTLAAGIAHEINNPLNSILMNAELALLKLEGEDDPARVGEKLETIIRDVKRCAGITESVLKLAKERTERVSPQDLNAIVRNARELVDSHLQLHDAAVALELADLPLLPLDATAMESALVNLLRNAAEAGRNGINVFVQTLRSGDEVVLLVSDDGPGIDNEHLDRIFDPFYSTKRASKGTGLGLSLVHRTVIEHHGSIRVRSRPGQGTTFEIRLPVSAGADPDDRPAGG